MRSLAWAVVFVVCVACAGRRGPRSQGPTTHALLLNGGGSPGINYQSHVRHLSGMYRVLVGRGMATDEISVLSGDGESMQPDVIVAAPAAGRDGWLLEGTFLERSLGRPMRYVSSNIKGVSISPATRQDVSDWLDDTDRFASGDTLFLFVTDHGERGKTPLDGRITLWNRTALSAQELGTKLVRLPPKVRVVMVMSQCFSGSFAELALPESLGGRPMGSVCGYFSAPADRPAYGCYPESRDDSENDGHAFRFIDALARSGTLTAAHAETLLTDRTPDVPMRSSDLFLARVVERTARAAGLSVDDVVTRETSQALASAHPDVETLRRLAESFGIEVPDNAELLATTTTRLSRLRDQLRASAKLWRSAMSELTQANLERLLSRQPALRDTLSPSYLDRRPLRWLATTQQEVVGSLAALADETPERRAQLQFGRGRFAATHTAAWRSEVRAAGLLRMRTVLLSLVGRQILAREGSPQERAGLEALAACESLALPKAEPPAPLPAVRALPPIANDERLAQGLVPASFGVAFAATSAQERTQGRLPGGAVRVIGVDEGSPAAAAGVRLGDLIVGSEGRPVEEEGGMKLHLASAEAQATTLDVLRDGQPLLLAAQPRKGASESEAKDLPAGQRASLRALAGLRAPVTPALTGQRPYLLFFWATWCVACKRAVPELLALERDKGITIVAITNEDATRVDAFLKSWPGGFPQQIAIDKEQAVGAAFDVGAYPTFVLVDGQGREQLRQLGYREDVGLPVPGWNRPKTSLKTSP